MKRILELYQSSVGKKVVMAVTGIVMVLFLIGHMIGNLKIFAGLDPITGRYKLDVYAAFLRSMGAPMFDNGQLLWMARLILLLCVSLHFITAFQLRRMNSTARQSKYAMLTPESSSFASRSMWWGGVSILLFIVYHLLHFTFGKVHIDDFIEGAVFHNVTSAFKNSSVILVYAVAMFAVLLHIWHGSWSVFQTLGIRTNSNHPVIRSATKVISLALVAGFFVVPLVIYFDLLR